jgi:hypothetical protein
MDSFVTVIKQHPGAVQVTRRVKVNVPGKFFPGLQPSESAVDYEGTAVESAERHSFSRHVKGWGAAHTGPGIRFICRSDTIDDPDHRGFWTTLSLWNRWRHNTYADNPEGEKPYLDPLPQAEAGRIERVVAAAEKKPPAVKDHFTVVSTEEHTVGGNGRMAGKKQVKTWYACKKEGCSRGACKPIPELGAATGQLFRHLDSCQPDLCQTLRVESKHSPVEIDADGNEYVLFSFDELLPHHVRYVQKCFRGFDHFYETRADNGLKEYVQGYQKRAALPDERTCQQLRFDSCTNCQWVAPCYLPLADSMGT